MSIDTTVIHFNSKQGSGKLSGNEYYPSKLRLIMDNESDVLELINTLTEQMFKQRILEDKYFEIDFLGSSDINTF